MDKIFSAVLFVLLSLNQVFAEEPAVKVGVIIPLSGDMAIHGVEVQRAMKLALSEREEEPLYNKYKFIFEDNQLKTPLSITAAQRLIYNDKVDAIVTLWPPTAEVVIPLSEKRKVFHYTISWDPELARKNKFVFSHQAMVDRIAQKTIKLVKSKARRFAFLHMEERGFNLGAGYIRKYAKVEGVDLVADESFNPEERDFRSLIARTRESDPELYLVWSTMPTIDLIIKEIRNSDPNIPITGYLDYAQNLDRLKGATYISEMYTSTGFLKAYKSRYNEVPISKGANAYDIANLLISAFERLSFKERTAGNLRKVLLEKKKYSGAVGEFSIDGDGNSTYEPAVRKIIGNERRIVTSKACSKPVVIGATLALSGKLAFIGGAERDGLLLAVEEINDNGGIGGCPLELVVEDNMGEAKAAVTSVKRLLQERKPDLIFSAFTHITQPVAEIVAKSDALMMYASSVKTMANSSRYVFRDYIDILEDGKLLAEQSILRKLSKVAVLEEESDSCFDFSDSFGEVASKGGVRVVKRYSYLPGDTDLKSLLLKIAQSKPEALIACTWRDSDLLMKQMAQLNLLSIPVFHVIAPFLPVADTPEIRKLYERNGSLSTWYGFVEQGRTVKQKRFAEKFKHRFGHSPRPDSAFTYDDLYVLKRAFEKCQGSESNYRKCVAGEIIDTKYDGVGGLLSFDENGNVARDRILMKVVNGKWQEMEL